METPLQHADVNYVGIVPCVCALDMRKPLWGSFWVNACLLDQTQKSKDAATLVESGLNWTRCTKRQGLGRLLQCHSSR